MSIFGAYGGPQFGLADVKIATYTSHLVYGTAVDVQSVQMMSFNLSTVTADLEGDDGITATHAKRILGEISLRWGAIRLELFEVMLGQTVDEYGLTPNRLKRLDLNEGNMPYLGVCGRMDAVEGVGDLHLFVPKAKLTSGLENIGGEYGAFTIPEATLKAVKDDNGVYAYLLMHEATTAVALPPALTA